MTQNRLYFQNLDSIRFFAALIVFFQHVVRPVFNYLPIKGTFLEPVLMGLSDGETGVSIFFVLSGFLITYLLMTEHELAQRVSIPKFYMRRLLRIWPLYYLLIIFVFFVYPVLLSIAGMQQQEQYQQTWYYFVFLGNFDQLAIHLHEGWYHLISQSVTWSVCVEEQFYLFWPLLFALLPRRFWLVGILAIIFGSIGFRIAYEHSAPVRYFHTFAVMVDLGIGALVAYLIKTYPNIRSRFQKTSTGTHILLLGIMLVLMVYGKYLDFLPYANALTRVILVIVFALVIAAQAMTSDDSRMGLGRIKFANRWGKYTYGFYLIHATIFTITQGVVLKIGLPVQTFSGSLLLAIGVFMLSLWMSILSYKYFESWFLRLKDRFAVVKTLPVKSSEPN